MATTIAAIHDLFLASPSLSLGVLCQLQLATEVVVEYCGKDQCVI